MIKVKNIVKQFKDLKAVNDVSLEIKKGEIVCLIGPSGSGKSTVLRCINGLEIPESGEIYINNQLLDSNDPQKFKTLRGKMGFVFQHFNLFPHKTILFYSSTRRRFSDAMACRSASEKPIRSSSKMKF